MSAERCFVDTNVLVYAYDGTAGPKHETARSLVGGLWETGEGCLSIQVLQEFFVTVTRKVPRPLSADTAAQAVADLGRWRVHSPATTDVLAAIDLHRRESVSFWDAMVIHSAAVLGCSSLRSEDLNHGQRYGGVIVRNPFLPGA